MEDFVSYKIAKKLKEKGFKEECVAHYYSNDPTCRIKNTALADYVRQPFCIESIKRSWNRCELNPCSSGCYYDVPTISQAMKWLRNEKNLFVYPCTVQLPEDERLGERSGKRMWDFSVDDLNIDDCIFESRSKYHSYEEAAMVGIEYVINNLI